MSTFSRVRRVTLISLGVVSGGLAYYKINREDKEKKFSAHNSVLNSHYTPNVKWDSNWDYRDPKSLLMPMKEDATPEEQNKYNEALRQTKSRATRHLFLIRHGQYNTKGSEDKERVLTELGRAQAELTGERLASLGVPWEQLVRSTMARAQETAAIIEARLRARGAGPACSDDALLREGAPVPPEPPASHYRPLAHQYFQDGARIEAAFRRHVHRAAPAQARDSYTLLVCHANVIRYFVCRALQLPPEAWLRLSLAHGSVTQLSVHANGHVSLRRLGDCGHMPPDHVTTA